MRLASEAGKTETARRLACELVHDNLLSNGSKYSPPSSCVRVVMQRCDQQVELRVIDEGEGIPPDFLRRIFEPFEQLGQRVERTRGGLGLGLTVAEFLIRLHEGKIEAYSRGPGRGSEFVVRLPLVEKAEMATETPAQVVPPRLARRVVIVEDNRDARETLQWLLEDDGYEVVTAETGPEGLRLIREHRPDVAIVDIGLPEMDGFAVAQAVRADPQLTNTYLIALTGYGQQEDRQAAFAAGFQAHLTKPVDLGELERIIRAHFASQEQSPPPPA